MECTSSKASQPDRAVIERAAGSHIGDIPTVSLDGDPQRVGTALDRACADIGFVRIIDHGIDQSLERRVDEMAREFFARDEELKARVAIAEGEAYGYGGYMVERLAASRGGVTPPDAKETYSIGPVDHPDDVAALIAADPAAAFAYSPNRWPEQPTAFADTMSECYRALGDLSARLLSLMARGLGMPADTFSDAIDRHTSALRLLHYPHIDPDVLAPGQLRAGAHSDYGTLTLLRTDAAPGGLEVLDRRGQWVPVAPRSDAYVVNIGDALERWTAGRWRSTMHRVQLPPRNAGNTERFSVAFFHNANWDAVISTLAACRGDGVDEPAPITAGRHLMERFRSTQY